MGKSEDHMAELTDPVYHKNGACVVRHASAQQKECKYEENGYDKTLASRSDWYNAPARYKLGLVDWNKVRPKMVKSPAGYKLKSFLAPAKGDKPHPHLWNIGKFNNFVPGGGFEHPYLHNWHHMIANEMLFTLLYDKTYGTKLLQVLMVGKYNLNHERNIVLLPKEDRVGVIIKWPVHPNNHGTYDKYAANKLSTLKDRLKSSLGKPKAHPVNAKNVGNYAEELHSISDELLMLLEQMGREQPGVHVNKVKQFGAAIEAKLAASGATPP